MLVAAIALTIMITILVAPAYGSDEETIVTCADLENRSLDTVPSGLQSTWLRCKISEDNPMLRKVLAGKVAESDAAKRVREALANAKVAYDKLKAAGVLDNSKLDEATAKFRDASSTFTRQKQTTEKMFSAQRAADEAKAKEHAETNRVRAVRAKLEAERLALVESYSRDHRNITRYCNEHFMWRMRWNTTFTEVYGEKGGAHFVIAEREKNDFRGGCDVTEWVSNDIKLGLIDVTRDFVQRINGTNVTEHMYEPIRTAAGEIYNITELGDLSDTYHKGDINVVYNTWARDKLPEALKKFDTHKRQAFLRIEREQRVREQRQAKTMFFGNLAQRSLTLIHEHGDIHAMSKARYESLKRTARNAEINKKFIKGGIRAELFFNTSFYRQTLDPRTTGSTSTSTSARLVFDQFMKKYKLDPVSITRTRSMLVSVVKKGMRGMPVEPTVHEKVSPYSWMAPLGHISAIVNDDRTWKAVHTFIGKTKRAIQRGYDTNRRSTHFRGVPANVRQYYTTHADSQRSLDHFSRAMYKFNNKYGKPFDSFFITAPHARSHMATSLFDPQQVFDTITDAINRTLFSCRPDILAPDPVYCAPYIDPDSPHIPHIPSLLNFSRRLYVNCTEHLIFVHKKVGALDGYFQRIGDIFGMLFTYTPGFNTLTFLTWKKNDIRRDYIWEIFFCGFVEVILLFVFIFVAAIILPIILQMITQTSGKISDHRRDQRLARLEYQVYYMSKTLNLGDVPLSSTAA